MDRTAIHDLTLRARSLLVAETRELLEGVYGLHADGRFEPAARLPAVQTLRDVRETRARLEKCLADEATAGLSRTQAVDKLVKETAFTHLNRLVAFKMLEARRLVRGTIDRYHESNAFKFYLADDAHADDLARYEAGDLPKNAVDEGPRETAYRRFLLWQSIQMAREINVLFDPDNLASRLFPRPRALKELIDLLNDPAPREAWAPGNEETIGWVYQYFNEQEKKDVFDRVFKQKQKIRVEEVPTVTQLFTPDWIVMFLVHNTLGRLWVRMHPDTGLTEKLDYLVPLAGPAQPVAVKRALEITLLDPACGTMHFGLVAFDLLVEMYKEEMDKAGQPGWPEAASVEREEDIPGTIVANNLFGIDIDLRAVQLSALTLFLKAKSLNKQAVITESNLACSDVLLLNGHRLSAFLEETGLTRPIYTRLIRGLWDRLQHANHMGSLLRLEAGLNDLIARERRKLEVEDATLRLPGFASEQFETEAGRQEFWAIIEAQIIQAFGEFARQQATRGVDETYFTDEATKGVRVLDVMLRRYDVVFTNPPYMSSRNMDSQMTEFLRSEYPSSKGDLYTAFIERCTEFLNETGRLGMITQQSFMFVSSYREMRKHLLERHAVETMCHVGPRAFEEIVGEKVNTTAFVLRREADSNYRANAIGTYFRLVKKPDSEAKRAAFERALGSLRVAAEADAVFLYRQADFDAIPGSPWVYWITAGLRRLFGIGRKLRDDGNVCIGMRTGDNFRFLRSWWEVGAGAIVRGCRSRHDAMVEVSGKRWFPYMKGGTFQRWYGNQEYVVEWYADGKLIKENTKYHYPELGDSLGWKISNEDLYFRRGVTWTDLTSGRFSARLSPGGFIFDVSGSSAFPEDIPLVLAVMNSSFAQYVLKLINPTMHVQVGDLARLPIPAASSDTLESLVDAAITLAKSDSAEDETTYDFVAPPWAGSLGQTLRVLELRREQLAEVERQIDEEVYRLYGISAKDRAAIEAELAAPIAVGDGEDEGKSETAGESEEEVAAGTALGMEELARRWIGYAVGIALGRFQPGIEGALGRGRFAPDLAEKLRALADADGIAPIDPVHEDDLAAKVASALELMLGEAGAMEVVHAALGNTADPVTLLRRYLERDFFKQHVQLYRKRPIYWLLQSPRRSYGLYLFQERITRDTLPLIRGNRYLGGKINETRHRIAEVHARAEGAEGREKKRLGKELSELGTLLADLEAFDQAIRRVLEARNERGETVGWVPAIDDGVILNLAPLHELIPSWKMEPRKYWGQLADGDFDWSHTAMRYWPKRALAKCKTN